jgi:putative tryptophan/tyrosine transport system substrate-binding protein
MDGTLRVEHRWVTSGAEQSKALAKELVSLGPDVVVVNSTPLLAVMANESRTIPIVFVRVADPVGQGLIASLARPGGNITGFTNFEFSMGGKWLQLLKDVSPSTERVAILFNPNTMPYALFVRSIEAAAPSFALKLQPSPAQNTGDIERIIEAFARDRNSGLIVLPDIFTIQQRQLIIGSVAKHLLPTIYPYGLFAKDGGLMSYGIDAISVYRDAAVYVDRILKGEKPADLPVQAPNKYELVINLKTAKTLGLDIPPKVLALADEVIE